ncbi:MAG: TrmB family transcriptional regulator [Candidatus Woesearchaeota archaeon]
MNESVLQEIGLTIGESKIYLALAKIGQTTTGPIAKESGVSASKVYKILDKLEVKGLIGKVIKGKITYYNASNPKQILHYIEDKEAMLQEKKLEAQKLVAQLLVQQNQHLENNASILQGFKAVTNAFTDIIDELKYGEKYKVLGATYNNIAGLEAFFTKHHKKRSDKKIKLFMLVNHDVNLVKTTATRSEIRRLPKELDQLMEIVLYKDKVLIVMWTSSPLAFLIQNKEANQSFNKYFETFWKNAKR